MPPTTRAEGPFRVGAAVLAAVLLAAFGFAAFLAIFFFAYSAEGEGSGGPDSTAAVLSVLAGAAAIALTIAVAWLGRVAATGDTARPGWRMCLIAPAVPALLIALALLR